MPFCSKCGREIEELGSTGQGICSNCGVVAISTSTQNKTQNPAYCVHCGKELSGEGTFCPHCGRSQKPVEAKPLEITPKATAQPIPVPAAGTDGVSVEGAVGDGASVGAGVGLRAGRGAFFRFTIFLWSSSLSSSHSFSRFHLATYYPKL